MLNWPVATAALVVQVTGRAAPWALLVVPVGAVTVMVLRAAVAVPVTAWFLVVAPALEWTMLPLDVPSVARLKRT